MQLEKAGKTSIFKKPWFWIAIVAIVIVFVVIVSSQESTNDDLQGSKYDASIELVKNGSPTLIPNITYQQAYENFFGNPQWRGFTADTGEKVVEFTGECTYYDEDAQVYIQFVIEGTDSFSLYYAHMNIGDETITMGEQMFVELVYIPFEVYSEEVLGKELNSDVQEAFEEIYESYY